MVVSLSLAAVKLTVNWPLSLGSDALASLAMIDANAVSSSVIVTVSLLLDGSTLTSVSSVLTRVTITVSGSSKMPSSTVVMSIVPEVSPAAMTRVRVRATKSSDSAAVPVTV